MSQNKYNLSGVKMIALIISVFCLTNTIKAQEYAPSFARLTDINVSVNGNDLLFPWLGGLNNPQFSEGDLNNDGFLDIVSASENDNTIAWYENDGNANPTFTATDITTSVNGARSIFAADLDGDGDTDLISGSTLDDTVFWHENLGGNNAPVATAQTDVAAEEQAVVTITLAGTDADAGDTHTYTLVSGTGSTDNASFTITGTTISTAAVFNFEAKNSCSNRRCVFFLFESTLKPFLAFLKNDSRGFSSSV